MLELKVDKGKVTVTGIEGTLGELIDDVLDIIRYFWLSQERAGWGAMTFRNGILDGVVNEGGDAQADKAWAWQPAEEVDHDR